MYTIYILLSSTVQNVIFRLRLYAVGNVVSRVQTLTVIIRILENVERYEVAVAVTWREYRFHSDAVLLFLSNLGDGKSICVGHDRHVFFF